MKIILSIICLIGISAGADRSYRLSTDVEPIHYKIELTPYFNNDTAGKHAFTFDGKVEIELKTMKTDINAITLHVEDLDISTSTLSSKGQIVFFFQNIAANKALEILGSEVDPVTNKHTLKLSGALEQNKSYVLAFEYTGKLRTDMHGFYRSSYQEGNVKKWLASTQMEPVHARKVFPCFDEPRFKATFDIIINRPASFQPSISNTPLKVNTTIDNIVREEFKTTPKMSTYLVAFVVSEFKCRENENKNFSVCSRPPAYDQTEYSFIIGQKTLAKFDELFNYTYNTHMEKMSMLAIPDFAAGAMENWGLLTYRETALLYQDKVSTSLAQQRVAAVVAHEQTHMWFGDLVTCDWWSHTWLNEGFARFFQYFGLAEVEPKWGLEEQFLVEQQQGVFGADSLSDSLPLSYDVNTPEEIGDRFGSISYNKGGSVIRMVEHTVGHDTFIASLRNYLKTNELKTAVPENLYAAFQKEVGDSINITTFFGSWVSQAGYPVVYVNASDNRDVVTVTQSRFYRNYNENHDSDSTLWQIPITFATNKDNSNFTSTKTTAFISTKKADITMPSGSVDWIVFNVQQSGYYRVNYADNLWSAIENVLNKSPRDFNVLNRAQIVDDALNLARAHHLSYKKALNTVGYLKGETDYAPWLSAFNNFGFILSRFGDSDAPIFKKYVLGLLENVYNYLGFQPKPNIDTRTDVYNRVNVLNHACSFGHEQCIKDAREEFEKLKSNPTGYAVPADLRPVVYCSVIREGAKDEWDFLWEKFKAENVAAETVVILNALGCTKDANLTTNYLNLILGNDVRLQDKDAAFKSTLQQRENLDLVLDYVIANHKNITEVFESESEVPSILSSIASRLTKTEQITKIRSFTEDNQLQSNKNIQSAVSNAEFNLKWADENVPEIKSFINSAATTTISFVLLLGVAFVTYFNF